MSGLSLLLETARRALMSQQVGMSVTSHNITNASTLGYSRQRVQLVATTPLKESFGMLGTGVMAQSIGRLRDRFLDTQVRSSNQTLGDASSQYQILSQVETSFNEPSSSGLSSAMTGFFNAFQSLSLHPEDSSSRNAVLQKGASMADMFHRLSSEMNQLRGALSDDVTTKVNRINTLTSELSQLDVQITNTIATGADPSDAKDQRDLKLEELSQLINISVSEDPRGSMVVSAGGTAIASRAGSTPLKATVVGNAIQIVTDPAGSPVDVTAGELGGTLKMYNTTLPDYLQQLDELAGAIISRVNTLHAAGSGLGTPPPTGINFFTGTSAADIGISNAVSTNINNIAASGDGTPGNNTVALALAGVLNEQLLRGNSVSPAQFYNGLVSQIGSAVASADNTSSSQELVLSQLENQRSSVSGVSLDEEMTNMIKFQRSYDAAAKLVTTTNDMFQTILNMV